jgi:hypothetical protein
MSGWGVQVRGKGFHADPKSWRFAQEVADTAGTPVILHDQTMKSESWAS